MGTSASARSLSIGETVRELQKTFPDVSHSSLRYLEREGLIHPRRTKGGHRQFRMRDLDRVRTIKEWQTEHFSLERIRQRLDQLDAMPSTSQISERFLDLAHVGEFHEAAAMVLGADDSGLPTSVVFDEILVPALVETGERWASGEITVSQEHEVSGLCRDLVAELTMRHMRRPTDGKTVVAASVEGEFHDLGLQMICGLLRQRGANVHFLGANVADRFLLESVQMRDPDLILLSVTIPRHVATLDQTLGSLRSARLDAEGPSVLIGGQGMDAPYTAPGQPGVRVMPPGSLQQSVNEILQSQR